MRDIDTILEATIRGNRVTVDYERAHGTETWLLCLRVNGALHMSRDSDDPPRDAQNMVREWKKPTRLFS